MQYVILNTDLTAVNANISTISKNLGDKQDASTAITTQNIGQQETNSKKGLELFSATNTSDNVYVTLSGAKTLDHFKYVLVLINFNGAIQASITLPVDYLKNGRAHRVFADSRWAIVQVLNNSNTYVYYKTSDATTYVVCYGIY